MRALSSHDVLRIWEQGRARRRHDPASLLLDAAYPQMSFEETADLPLGRRNVMLLRVREELFGPGLNAFAECPQCGMRLEMALETSPLAGLEEVETPARHTFAMDGYEVAFRLPSGRDMTILAGCRDVAGGRALLLQRCVLQASQDGTAVPVEALPESVTTRLAERMAECDPQAEILLDLSCPGCGHGWQASLDIAEFLWAEVVALARRLAREVHALARAYGWSEADILSMSAARRQLYIEMAV